jgi:hypothetical protein
MRVSRRKTASNPSKKAQKMAIPPHLGMGMVCTFLRSGMSTAPQDRQRFLAKGTIAAEKQSESRKRPSRVVMVFQQYFTLLTLRQDAGNQNGTGQPHPCGKG